jgi:uncharacterized membrane protein
MAEAKKSDDNIFAAVAYLVSFISGAVIYIMYKDKGNKFVLFHAMQSIIAGIAIMAVFMVMGIGGTIMAFIPGIGWLIGLLMLPLWLVLCLGSFALWVFCMYKAFTGEKFLIPVIGKMAEKYAG